MPSNLSIVEHVRSNSALTVIETRTAPKVARLLGTYRVVAQVLFRSQLEVQASFSPWDGLLKRSWG